jgi:hypothetical protein
MERSMHTLQATPIAFAVPKKALWLMTALICSVVLSLTAATTYALDLVAFAGIAGPLTAALAQLATLAPGVKALITVERLGVQKSWIATFPDPTAMIEFPITPDHLPEL